MSVSIIVRNANDFKTSQWSGGSTTELYIYPEDAQYREGNFQCRISSATVETDRSDFTPLPGVKRYLSIFGGSLEMVHGQETRVQLKPYEVDCFDGGVPTVSFGKVVDFNLMLKNGADGKMETARIRQGETLRLTPGQGENLLAVYVKEGRICLSGTEAAREELALEKDWKEEITITGCSEEEAGIGICRICL